MNPYIKVSGLFIYPVKSLRGITLDQAVVEARGFRYDRRWMVVDEQGTFMTQRDHPRMSLITTGIEADRLHFRAPGMAGLTVSLVQNSGEIRSVVVWDDSLKALEVAGAGQWFSTFLETKCSLVYMPDDADRPVDPKRAPPGSQVGFADAFPFLLISEASLEDLNTRLETPIPMSRFRPNIVVRGCEPFAEDRWRRIVVGGIPFSVVKPCARCTITTVDQETGQRGVEPLRTLASFRQWDGHVWFGQNAVQEGRGTVSLGDPVAVVVSSR